MLLKKELHWSLQVAPTPQELGRLHLFSGAGLPRNSPHQDQAHLHVRHNEYPRDMALSKMDIRPLMSSRLSCQLSL